MFVCVLWSDGVDCVECDVIIMLDCVLYGCAVEMKVFVCIWRRRVSLIVETMC